MCIRSFKGLFASSGERAGTDEAINSRCWVASIDQLIPREKVGTRFNQPYLTLGTQCKICKRQQVFKKACTYSHKSDWNHFKQVGKEINHELRLNCLDNYISTIPDAQDEKPGACKRFYTFIQLLRQESFGVGTSKEWDRVDEISIEKVNTCNTLSFLQRGHNRYSNSRRRPPTTHTRHHQQPERHSDVTKEHQAQQGQKQIVSVLESWGIAPINLPLASHNSSSTPWMKAEFLMSGNSNKFTLYLRRALAVIMPTTNPSHSPAYCLRP